VIVSVVTLNGAALNPVLRNIFKTLSETSKSEMTLYYLRLTINDFLDKKNLVVGLEKMDGGQNKQNCVHVVIRYPCTSIYFCSLGHR
jgi:hypothetical protein